MIAINERDYRVLPRQDAARISEERACLEGRTVYYVERRDSWRGEWQSSAEAESDEENFVFKRHWKSAQVPRGVFVSATALSSFAGSIVVKEI